MRKLKRKATGTTVHRFGPTKRQTEKATTTIQHLIGKKPEELQADPECGICRDSWFGVYGRMPMPTEARPVSLDKMEVLDDKTFWRIIEKAEWSKSKRGGHRKIRETWARWVRKKYTEDQIQALEKGYQARRQMLRMVHECYIMATGDAVGTGDDGYGDLLDHVMGCGEEEYVLSMADPRRISERARKNQYTENFHYLFHAFFDKELNNKPSRNKKEIKDYPQSGPHTGDARMLYEPWLVRYFQVVYGTL